MKKIVAVLLVAISLLFSINFAFADSVPLSSTQWVLPSNGFGGGSRANPVDTVLSYSDMASLLTSVNSGLKSGAYSGFTGKARISYTGSFYFITLVLDGDTYWLCNGSGGRYRTEPENITTDSTTTTPSTNAPTTTPSTTDAGNGANGTYIPTHSSASNDTGLLRQIAQYTHEIWFWADLINDNLRDVRRYLFMVYSNVGRFVDGMNNITKGIYRQIDLLSGYLPRLDDIYNRLFQTQSAAWASVDVENRLLYSLEGLASNISGVIVDGAVKVTSSPDPVVAEAITGIQNTLTTISNQITEQFGEYESTYSFPDVSAYGQLATRNKIVSGALSSAFSSINPGSDILFYSPSSTLTLSKNVIYTAGRGNCFQVGCDLCPDSTYGLGYLFSFQFRFPTSQSTDRTETVQFPRVGFTDYSGKTLTLYEHTGSVRVPAYSTYVCEYSYYFPRWDASGNWLGWSGLNDTFELTSSSHEPSNRVYLAPPESCTYYIYGTSDTAIPVVYASRFTGFLQSQTDRVVNAVGSIPAPTDYTYQMEAVTGRMDDILAQLQTTSGSATCEHTYSQHMEQEATCILPGLQVSTCSQCGDSYSEIIDPLGHDWVISSHVDAVTDPDTGEETASAYDIYTCSRCGKTYEDHTGDGAPDEDYSSSSISQLVVKVFSKLGTFAGKLIGFIVRLFDKAISSVDEVISKFNEYTEQISGFGGDYPAWLTGFWTVLPSELQVALTFAVVCMVLGIVGKKLFFS